MKQFLSIVIFSLSLAIVSNAQDLSKHGIADSDKNELGGLQVGDQAPDFSAIDHLGNEVSLKSELLKGPVILVFYRGYWCPICSRHLSSLQNELDQLTEKGVRVLAVSPEKVEYTQKAATQSGLTFPILSDEDGQLMKDYKVFFRVTEAYQDKVTGYFDFQLEDTQSTGDANLPVPATYLIGMDGKIKYAFYDPNYRKRADVKELMGYL